MQDVGLRELSPLPPPPLLFPGFGRVWNRKAREQRPGNKKQPCLDERNFWQNHGVNADSQQNTRSDALIGLLKSLHVHEQRSVRRRPETTRSKGTLKERRKLEAPRSRRAAPRVIRPREGRAGYPLACLEVSRPSPSRRSRAKPWRFGTHLHPP